MPKRLSDTEREVLKMAVEDLERASVKADVQGDWQQAQALDLKAMDIRMQLQADMEEAQLHEDEMRAAADLHKE